MRPLFRLSRLTVLFLVGCLMVVAARARPGWSDEPSAKLAPADYYRTLRRAHRLFDERKHADALPLYQSLVQTSGDDADVWRRLAECQYQAKQYAPAAESYQRAYALGAGSKEAVALQVGRMFARLGDADNAFRWYQRALDEGLEDRLLLAVDMQTESIGRDPRAATLTARLPEGKFTREEGWRFDLSFLMSEARRLYPDLYTVTSREKIDAVVRSLEERVGQLTDEQMLVELQKLVTSFGGGHTNVVFDNKRIPLAQLPIRMYWFADGIFIIDAEDESLIGARLVQIGNTAAEDLRARLESICSRDNDTGITARGPGFLTFPAMLRGLDIIGEETQVPLVVEDRQQQRRQLKLEPGPAKPRKPLVGSKLPGAPPLPLFLTNINKAIWHQSLDDGRTLYVQFNSVRNERGESLADYALRLRSEIGAGKFQNLVLDLRHNGGGNSFLTVELLRTLIHFETGAPQRRLFAIAGRHTFSAAMNFAIDVDRLTNAVFVGEPTGSSLSSIGEFTPVTLPYSKVRVAISSRYWQMSYPHDTRTWIAPEIPAPVSSADYFANRDPALEAIQAVLAAEPEPDASAREASERPVSPAP